MTDRTGDYRPYHHFTMAEWSTLSDGQEMTLGAADLDRLRALNDPISLSEAEEVYLPLTRLLSLYHEAVASLHRVSKQFLRTEGAPVPFIIGVAGSVAVGKSTTARVLHALMQRWPGSPRVSLITTDGFLYSNKLLEERGLMQRKGFPESYDRARFIEFLAAVKSGEPRVAAPLYSHLVYDVVDAEETIVERPDILIVEGLNILQPGDLPRTGAPIVFASDFLDFSIYIHAEQADLEQWFVERFFRLRDTAFRDPHSFFHQFSKLSETKARDLAVNIWREINLPNLLENILPTRGRADLVLTKAADHSVKSVDLRKL